MKPVLLLDCDGIVADCASAVHKFATELLPHVSIPPIGDWDEYAFEESMRLSEQDAERFHLRARLDATIPYDITLYPGAVEDVTALQEVAEVVFVTAPWDGMFTWMPWRAELLKVFDAEVIFTHNKSRVLGDYLVDDKVSTLRCPKKPWKPLLFSRPWNRHDKTLPRVSSLKEVLERITR